MLMGIGRSGVAYVNTADEAYAKLDLYLRRLAAAEADQSSILAAKYRSQVSMWAAVAQALMMRERR